MPPRNNSPPLDADIAQRLARFTRTNNPLMIWPALPAPTLLAARLAIETVMRRVLAGDTPSLDTRGEIDLYAIRIAAYTTGTGALLGRWVEDGRIHAAPAVGELLATELEQGRRRAIRVEREVLPAIDALLARHITPVILKGFHIARAYCEEPGVRPSADVDLLVPAARVRDAEQALLVAGFEPMGKPVPSPYKRTWIGVHVDRRIFSLDGVDERDRWDIDLHTSFDRRAGIARINLDAGARHVETFQVAGRALLVPTQPLLLMVLACQLSTDINAMRLMRVFDLVRVITADRGSQRLDWDEVLLLMRRSESARFAYPGLALAEALSPGTVPPHVLEETRSAASWGTRNTVARLVPGGASFATAGLVQRLMWARNPLEVAMTLLALVRGDTPLEPRAVVRRGVKLARLIASGAFSLKHPDEHTTPLRNLTIRDRSR